MSSEFNLYMQLEEMNSQADAPQAPPTSQMRSMTPMQVAQFPAADFMQQYNSFGIAVTGMPVSGYPMTPVAPGGSSIAGPSMSSGSSMPSLPQEHPTRSRKRKPRLFVSKSDYGGVARSSGSELQQRPVEPPPRKTKSSYGAASACDEEADDIRSIRTCSDKKQNHSEIEKRRRDKMNTYITELGAMVPMCRALNRKLDKLTILRLAVQHLRNVRGAISAGPLTIRPLPAILSESEQNALVLRAAAGCFVVVVGCDRGRMMYVSASVAQILNFHQTELLGQSFFDLLHPKDVAKVKEQMSSSESGPRERLIDAKTMLPVNADQVSDVTRLSPGSRRSFFCRVKCQAVMGSTLVEPMKLEPDMPRKKFNKKYCLVQCTGYLKAWAPGDVSDDADNEAERDPGMVPCLIAIARAMPDYSARADDLGPAPRGPLATPTSVRPLQYISRHTAEGKFLFVDQRVTVVLGFLPHELVGTSVYEYVVGEDHTNSLADVHRETLLRKMPVESPPYVIRRKNGSHAVLITHFKYLNNAWTKELECLVANNTLLSDGPQEHDNDEDGQIPYFKDVLTRLSVDANSKTSAQPSVLTNIEASSQGSAQTSVNFEWITQIRLDEWSNETNANIEEIAQTSVISDVSSKICNESRALISITFKEIKKICSELSVEGSAQTGTRTQRAPTAYVIAKESTATTSARAIDENGKVSTQTSTKRSTQPSAVIKKYAEANANRSVVANVKEKAEANAKESAEESVDAKVGESADVDDDPGADTTSVLSHLTEAVGEEVQRMIVSRAASLKLGSTIAEEALRSNPTALSPEPSVDILHDVIFSQQPTINDSLLNCDSPYPFIRNNVSLGEAGGVNTPPPESQTEDRTSGSPPPPTSPNLPNSTDGNGEAVMAVLMNLLEADAGLGGPVNMSTLPWVFP